MVTKRPATNWAEIVSTAASRPIIRLKRGGNAGPSLNSKRYRRGGSDARARNRSNKAIASALDVRDVAVPEFAVAKRFSDPRYVNAEAALLDRDTLPDPRDQILLGDGLTCVLHQNDENIQGARAQVNWRTRFFQKPLGRYQPERAK